MIISFSFSDSIHIRYVSNVMRSSEAGFRKLRPECSEAKHPRKPDKQDEKYSTSGYYDPINWSRLPLRTFDILV
ncbi:hypothetical protein MLD38_035768 [Melastoma candidum]|uniref:Uncharacterized protein n=1 Tax=Melastoma candidum TaxID=119954 RepID=A0ACB9LH06_9MYRT|nr:hypothetical protein MLD38_035768 [Melastoma candidum]